MSNSLTSRNANPLISGDRIFYASGDETIEVDDKNKKSVVLHAGDIIFSKDGTTVSVNEHGDEDIIADGLRGLTESTTDDVPTTNPTTNNSGFWTKLFGFANDKQQSKLILDEKVKEKNGSGSNTDGTVLESDTKNMQAHCLTINNCGVAGIILR